MEMIEIERDFLLRISAEVRKIIVEIERMSDEQLLEEMIANKLRVSEGYDVLRHRLFRYRLLLTTKGRQVPWEPKIDQVNEPRRRATAVVPKASGQTADKSKAVFKKGSKIVRSPPEINPSLVENKLASHRTRDSTRTHPELLEAIASGSGVDQHRVQPPEPIHECFYPSVPTTTSAETITASSRAITTSTPTTTAESLLLGQFGIPVTSRIVLRESLQGLQSMQYAIGRMMSPPIMAATESTGPSLLPDRLMLNANGNPYVFLPTFRQNNLQQIEYSHAPTYNLAGGNEFLFGSANAPSIGSVHAPATMVHTNNSASVPLNMSTASTVVLEKPQVGLAENSNVEIESGSETDDDSSNNSERDSSEKDEYGDDSSRNSVQKTGKLGNDPKAKTEIPRKQSNKTSQLSDDEIVRRYVQARQIAAAYQANTVRENIGNTANAGAGDSCDCDCIHRQSMYEQARQRYHADGAAVAEIFKNAKNRPTS